MISNEDEQLYKDAARLLDYVVSEWRSDPMSIQCFDLRLVKQAKEIVAELKARGELQ